MELLRVLAPRLRDADRKRLEFAALDTLGRVAGRLQELGERFDEQTANGIEVELPLSQEQLARCGASREATVKALAAPRARVELPPAGATFSFETAARRAATPTAPSSAGSLALRRNASKDAQPRCHAAWPRSPHQR